MTGEAEITLSLTWTDLQLLRKSLERCLQYNHGMAEMFGRDSSFSEDERHARALLRKVEALRFHRGVNL